MMSDFSMKKSQDNDERTTVRTTRVVNKVAGCSKAPTPAVLAGMIY